MPMRRMSIKFKLITTLTLILVFAFTLVSLLNYRLTRQAARQELLTSSLPLTSENIYSEIKGDLLRPIFISSLMANDTFLQDWVLTGERDSNKITNYLLEIQRQYGFFSAFFVSANTMKYYHFNGILKTVSPDDDHDVWYYDFLALDKDYDLDVDTNQAGGNRLTIFINYRVLAPDGQLLGVTGVGLEMGKVAKLLKLYQRKYDRSIYTVDPHGVIQTNSNPDLILTTSIHDLEGIGQLAEQILVPGPEPRQYEYDRGDRHILISSRYIPELDWYLIVEQDETSILATARANMLRTISIGIAVSLIIIFISILTVNHFQGRLERMAGTDELTGVANRREFEAEFARASHRRARYDLPLSMVLVDLDNLKAVNDRCGHLEGDKVIQGTARIIQDSIRGGDLVARWGGDEFVVLLEGGLDEAVAVTERIRERVAREQMPGMSCHAKNRPTVTLSCGVAEFRKDDDLLGLTSRADQALYKAKEGGRNQVMCEGSG